MERAAYLLEVVARFIDENPIAEYTVDYDETTCDGHCLKEDCLAEAESLRNLMRLKADVIAGTW